MIFHWYILLYSLVDERELVLFEYVDTENTNQYKAILKLNPNKNNKEFISSIMLINDRKITDECYNLDNLAEQGFSIVELKDNCLIEPSNIKYSFQSGISSNIMKLRMIFSNY